MGVAAVFVFALLSGVFPGAAFSSGGYRDAVLADNPVGYWRLAESSGTTITDELGAGHSGGYTGAVTLGQTSPITSDSTDTATYFNGGWGSIPYYADLNPTGNKLSIEFWWKGAAPDGAQFAVLKGYTSHSDPYYQYGVGAGPSGTVRVVVDTSGSFNPWDTGVSWPGDGSWHHIVVTYDGSVGSNNLKLYIDKTLRAQTNKTGNVRGYSSALGLMDILNLGSGYQTAGRLDEVAIYNSALSADRVSAHYDAAIPPAAPTNTTLPAISGTAIEGQTLSADNGSWTGNPTSYSKQWRRCDSGGANCADISGATDSSYTLSTADVDSTIRVAVTATNAGGSTSAASRGTGVVAGSGASLTYKQSVVADNPVGFWRLSEASGTTIIDELSAGHGGSYSGAVTLGQSGPILSDATDTAAYFGGGWGSIPYYADLNPTGNKVSIEFWWKGSAPSAARFMVLKGYTSHIDPYYQYGLGDDGNGNVRAVVDTSGIFNPWDTGVAWPGDGAWHQIVLTYDGSLGSNNLKLYVDATLRAQTGRTGNVRAYSSALGLMDILNLGSGFQTSGRLDDVAIYNGALGSSRITAHFNASGQVPPANLTVPAISGTSTESWTLGSSNGTWTGLPSSYSWQWKRCGPDGSGCADIDGANGSSYLVTDADVGSTIRVAVTASNAAGSSTAQSAATAVVEGLHAVDPPVDETLATQPAVAYNGAWVSATQWVPRAAGGYQLAFQRRATGAWETGVYQCVGFSDWPWNTCGNNTVSYDGGAGGYYNYRKEIWDDFGPGGKNPLGTPVQTGTYCGDTGLGAPAENPCFSIVWASDGIPSDNQDDPVDSDLANEAAASAEAISPSGPVSSDSYSTIVATSDETEMPSGISVVTSTADGTWALTGGVIDINSGAPISGASVQISYVQTCSSCNPPPPPSPVTATASSSGAFAFINMPLPPTDYAAQLTVTSSGYGTYTLTNLVTEANNERTATVMLDADNQTWDDAIVPTSTSSSAGDSEYTIDNSLLATIDDAKASGLYGSVRRIPPMIKVHEYSLLMPSCSQGSHDYHRHWYRTEFYLLHVLRGESYAGWPEQAIKANMAAAENYAWYFMLKTRDSSKAALTNTSLYQCFPRAATTSVKWMAQHPAGPHWSSWLHDDVEKTWIGPDDAVLETQFHGAGGSGDLCPTGGYCYDAVTCGSTDFTDSVFDGLTIPLLNQWGSKKADEVCGNSWGGIIDHYFSAYGTVQTALKPPGPNMVQTNNFLTTAGHIVFKFGAFVGKFPVGWTYVVVRSSSYHGSGTIICCQRHNDLNDPTGRAFPQRKLDYVPPADSRSVDNKCYYYRVQARNPSGKSTWVDFVSFANAVSDTGHKEICPAGSS
jgi:Concanavalin A-like lectin/glucanases superfamily